MTSRRKFMQSGIAAAAVAASPLVCIARAAERAPGGPARHRPFKVLFASTSASGLAFGAEAARHGAPVLAIGDDLGGIWMRELEPRLRAEPAAIAGLTGGAPLFCLEYLARSYDLGVVYRIEHARRGNGRFGHTITGAAPAACWADELAAHGEDWARAAARLAAACPADRQPDPAIPLLDLAARPDRSGALFSWMLAPKENDDA